MNWKDRIYESLTKGDSTDGKTQSVGTVRSQQKGMRLHGGRGKETTTHTNEKGQTVIVTRLPGGKTKTTILK